MHCVRKALAPRHKIINTEYILIIEYQLLVCTILNHYAQIIYATDIYVAFIFDIQYHTIIYCS